MGQRRLVTGHLERVSGRVMEQYPRAVRELIRGRSGVYALYRRDRLYYVGLASNLMRRLGNHLRDRHNGKWDRFSVYLTLQDDHMKELESMLLRISDPPGNRTGGKFNRSTNLRTTLYRRIRDTDRQKWADLLGGNIAARSARSRARRGNGARALEGLFSRATTLRAERNGWEYTARLRKDGTIRYGDEVFDSPTGAARAALGSRRVNGWTFWRYRHPRKGWIPLKTLRGR